ncbi:hypothetical protein, partial [Salmonella sp. SAL4449]|uniref:hypothetical protein n=1 Tax=Salmonella sp. SAL4449 TaxID=3159904 RepID=UPI003978D09E
MLEAVTELLTAWRASLPAAAPAGLATRVGEDLLARWSESHRHYHDLSHLGVVLAVIDEHAGWAEDGAAVRLAAWYH